MRWNTWEDEFLHDHYTNLGPHRCGMLLARSWSSITKRAHRLGIKIGPKFSGLGLNREAPAILYLVSFPVGDVTIYKLGITGVSVEERYKDEYKRLKMKTEWVKEFPTGQRAYDEEQRLLAEYSDNLVNTGVLRTGNTETLNIYIEKEYK